MFAGVASGRLAEERKAWRKSHPHGFTAKPDGSTNLFLWRCTIPGLPGTDWEGGYYPLTMEFSEDYPTKPPKCRFPSNFFHPNIYSNGGVCLSILDAYSGWRPSMTVKQILFGIQEMLNRPNPDSAANKYANDIFMGDPDEYTKHVRAQAQQYPHLH